MCGTYAKYALDILQHLMKQSTKISVPTKQLPKQRSVRNSSVIGAETMNMWLMME